MKFISCRQTTLDQELMDKRWLQNLPLNSLSYESFFIMCIGKLLIYCVLENLPTYKLAKPWVSQGNTKYVNYFSTYTFSCRHCSSWFAWSFLLGWKGQFESKRSIYDCEDILILKLNWSQNWLTIHIYLVSFIQID